VELFYTRAGPKGQAAMDIFADLTGMLFFGFLLWQAYNEAIFSVQIDESTFGLIRIPLWPARIILASGTALLILQLMVDLSTDIERFRHGEEVITLDDVIRKEIGAAATIIDDVDIDTKVGS
jgi:TRAP-type C4-dicarboxylate transport system permease small subunit